MKDPLLVLERVEARVTPPHGSGAWSTPEPMSVEDLTARLFDHGCHPTDIGDAFFQADPDWDRGTAG